MTDYQFDPILVIDPVTHQRASNATVTVYAITDTANASPLGLKDVNGDPLPNPLSSNDEAIIPAFSTTSSHVKLVAGTLAVVQASYDAILDEARAAKEFVEGIGVKETLTGPAGSEAVVSIDSAGQFSFMIPKGEAGAKGDKGEPGVWSSEFQARGQGFWPIYSETPPSNTTMYGMPVLWFKPSGLLTDIPQIPPQPLWDNTKREFTIPAGVVGVVYKNSATGQVLTQGTVVPAPTTLPAAVDVVAIAQPGYTASAPFSWKHWFPNPALSTLIASDGFTGPDGSGLNGRNVDNALGGTSPLKWVRYGTGGDAIHVVGNQAKNLTLSPVRYDLDTGARNHRIEFDMVGFGWSGSDQDAPLSVMVGSSVGLLLGQNRLRLICSNESGGSQSLVMFLGRRGRLSEHIDLRSSRTRWGSGFRTSRARATSTFLTWTSPQGFPRASAEARSTSGTPCRQTRGPGRSTTSRSTASEAFRCPFSLLVPAARDGAGLRHTAFTKAGADGQAISSPRPRVRSAALSSGRNMSRRERF